MGLRGSVECFGSEHRTLGELEEVIGFWFSSVLETETSPRKRGEAVGLSGEGEEVVEESHGFFLDFGGASEEDNPDVAVGV